MSLQLPIMAYNVSYNRITTSDKALYYKDGNELLSLLRNTTDEVYRKVSDDMLSIANVEYLWSKIAQDYLQVIRA